MSDVGMILQRLGATLVNEVAPKLEGDYSGGHASMAGLMAVMAGEMWEKEADLLDYPLRAYLPHENISLCLT